MTTSRAIAALILFLSACKTTSSDVPAATAPTNTAPSSAAPPTSTGPEKQSSAPNTITSAANANPEESKILAEGRELTSLFYKGETASIWVQMTEEMKKGLKSEEALKTASEQLAVQLGSETKVVDEKIVSSQGFLVYMRIVSFSKWHKPMNITWTLDSQNHIAGFYIKPVEQPK